MKNNKKSLELQTEPAFEPSQIARMAPEDASFLIECLMNRLQEEFEQKQEEIYKHAGAFKGQDLTIPLGSKTIKIQGGTGEVGHISEKFIENEQKAAVGKFRLKEPYWRHRIFDDDYDNDGKPDSWIGSPTVKDAAKILANAIPGAGPALSFLIDAGDALYSGLVEHNWSAAAGMLGSAVAGFVPGGGSLLGNIASSFAKAGIKEAFSIIGEAASNGWDFKKIRLGEHLKSVAISGAVSSFNAWAGAKLGINYQKPALGDALKMAAVNFGSRTLSFALNEGFKAIEQGTDCRFDWNKAGRQLAADAVLSVAETGAFIAEEKWGDAYSGAWRKHKGFFSRAGLRMADMLISGVKDYTLGFLQNAADRWVEKGGSMTVKDLARSSGLAMRAAWSEMGDRGRVQAEMLVRWLIERGVKKVWEGVKTVGRWAWSAVKGASGLVGEVWGAVAAQFVHNRREERRAIKTVVKKLRTLGEIETKLTEESAGENMDPRSKLANEIKEKLKKEIPEWALKALEERGVDIDKLAEVWAARKLVEEQGGPKKDPKIRKEAIKAADKEFYRRHPGMRGKKLDPKNPKHQKMIKEWKAIYHWKYNERLARSNKEYSYLLEPAGFIVFRNTVEKNIDYTRVEKKYTKKKVWRDGGGLFGEVWNAMSDFVKNITGIELGRIGHYEEITVKEEKTYYYHGVTGTEDIFYVTYDGIVEEKTGYQVKWAQKTLDEEDETYEYPTYEGRYELEYKPSPHKKKLKIHVKGKESGVYIHSGQRSEGCLLLPKSWKSTLEDIEKRLKKGQRIDVVIKNIDKRSEIDKELRPIEGADR